MKTTITLEKPVAPPIESCVLVLDVDELILLYTILQRVGGSPRASLRKYADTIRHKIKDACTEVEIDSESLYRQDQIDTTLGAGNIYFK